MDLRRYLRQSDRVVNEVRVSPTLVRGYILYEGEYLGRPELRKVYVEYDKEDIGYVIRTINQEVDHRTWVPANKHLEALERWLSFEQKEMLWNSEDVVIAS